MQLYSTVSWGFGPLKARLELKDQPLRWPQHRAGRAVLALGGRPLFLSRWFSGLLEGLQDMVVNFLQSKRFRREKVEATKWCCHSVMMSAWLTTTMSTVSCCSHWPVWWHGGMRTGRGGDHWGCLGVWRPQAAHWSGDSHEGLVPSRPLPLTSCETWATARLLCAPFPWLWNGGNETIKI